MPEWLKGTGCKPVGGSLRRFESYPAHRVFATCCVASFYVEFCGLRNGERRHTGLCAHLLRRILRRPTRIIQNARPVLEMFIRDLQVMFPRHRLGVADPRADNMFGPLLSEISFRRTATRKNCLAIPQRRRTVWSGNPGPIRCSRNESAPPGVMSRSSLSAPKKPSRLRRACPYTVVVPAFTSWRPLM